MFSKTEIIFFSLAIFFCLCESSGDKKSDSPKSEKPLKGGWSTISVNDPKVQKIANTGITLLNEKINSKYGLKLIKISTAKSQIVSGVNYRITTHIGHCRNSKECEFHKTQNCTMILWEQAWLNSTRLTKFECSKARFEPLYKSPEMVPGGVAATPKDDKQLLDAAKFAGEKLCERAGKNYKVTVKKIHEATQQVVAGMKYVLIADVHIKDSTNPSNTVNDKTTCLLQVVSQSRMKPPYELLAHDCDNSKYTTLFSLKGSVLEVKPK